MKIALTKYGMPQVVVLPAVLLAAMILCFLIGINLLPLYMTVAVEAVLLIALVWVLSFFRDPTRKIPLDKNVLLAPADGKITDIETVQENTFINGPSLRIGIFLNIFNVHINRAPCRAVVEQITYKKGSYKNAKNIESGRVNESNDIGLVRFDGPKDKLLIRQISGAIARRIICDAGVGQNLAGGEKFGMIKFGSRTELYVPIRENNTRCLVKPGDKAKAGLTILIRYE